METKNRFESIIFGIVCLCVQRTVCAQAHALKRSVLALCVRCHSRLSINYKTTTT